MLHKLECDSSVYDYGFHRAYIGANFEHDAVLLAYGETCSDRYVRRFDALERGYAAGMQAIGVYYHFNCHES